MLLAGRRGIVVWMGDYVQSTCDKLFSRCSLLLQGLYERKFVVVHHWDADGIASAAILLRLYGDRVEACYIPPIEVYGFDWLEQVPVKTLVFLDYALPAKAYAALASRKNVEVVVFDHHHVESIGAFEGYCNPIALKCGSEREWPSTSYLLYKIANSSRKLADLALVGVAADVGYQEWSVKLVEELARQTSTPIRVVWEAVEKLDACYRVGDRDCISYAVQVLAKRGIEGVIEDTRFEQVVQNVKRVFAEYSGLEPVEVRDLGWTKLMVYEIITTYHIGSMVSKHLSRTRPSNIVVLIHSLDGVKVKVYVRSAKHAIGSRVCVCARNKNYYCVSKDRVAVLEFPPNRLPIDFVEWLASCLRG